MIPLSVPNIKGNEWKYVKECLDTEWVSSAGKFVDLFEKKMEQFTGSKYAVACVNGTSALQVSLKLAGVEEGDEVIVPSLTFIAPVNAIRYNNAFPIFMDSDDYYNINVEKTIQFLIKETKFINGKTINSSTRRKISAIVPVHIWGNACNLSDLVELCKKRNIKIVEDASESLGTYFKENMLKGKHTGRIGLLGCISFNGNKIMTTGGGGMILTDDENLFEKAKYLTTQAKDDPVRYIHNEVGFNFRLTNIQSALGVAQLEQLPKFLKHKKFIYEYYKKNIEQIKGLKIASEPTYSNNNHWINLIQIDSNVYGEDREQLMQRLSIEKVQTRPVWALNHEQEPYKTFQAYQIENAKKLVKNSLCIPSSSNLSNDEMAKVVDLLSG